jgi:hypothetical protein
MKEFLVNNILDRYEKAIESNLYYKERVNRHEDQIRKFNKEIQDLKSEIWIYKAKLEELQNNKK